MSDAPPAPVTENGVPPATQEKVEEQPGVKVFVGNLAYTVTDEGLKSFFLPVEAEILTAHVIMRKTRAGERSAGYGFVSVTSSEAAQKAVDLLQGKDLEGRGVIVEIAKPAEEKDKEKREKKAAKPRVGRRGAKAVPGEVTEAEANGEVNDEEGAAKGEAPKKKKASKKKKVKAALLGEGAVEGEGAAAEGEGENKSKAKKPKTPRPPKRPAGEDPVGEPSKTMLFVANLGFNVDDAGLSTLFTDAGINVVSARIVRRRWGQPRKSKGYGFVDVGVEDEQKKAIEALDGKEVGGRPIAVKVAVNTPHEDEDNEAPTAEVKAEAEAEAATPEAQVLAT